MMRMMLFFVFCVFFINNNASFSLDGNFEINIPPGISKREAIDCAASLIDNNKFVLIMVVGRNIKRCPGICEVIQLQDHEIRGKNIFDKFDLGPLGTVHD